MAGVAIACSWTLRCGRDVGGRAEACFVRFGAWFLTEGAFDGLRAGRLRQWRSGVALVRAGRGMVRTVWASMSAGAARAAGAEDSGGGASALGGVGIRVARDGCERRRGDLRGFGEMGVGAFQREPAGGIEVGLEGGGLHALEERGEGEVVVGGDGEEGFGGFEDGGEDGVVFGGEGREIVRLRGHG